MSTLTIYLIVSLLIAIFFIYFNFGLYHWISCLLVYILVVLVISVILIYIGDSWIVFCIVILILVLQFIWAAQMSINIRQTMYIKAFRESEGEYLSPLESSIKSERRDESSIESEREPNRESQDWINPHVLLMANQLI